MADDENEEVGIEKEGGEVTSRTLEWRLWTSKKIEY